MKKLFLTLFALTALVLSSSAAVTLNDDLNAALPRMDLLPPPPEIGSPVWLDDSVKYFQYKERRLKDGEANPDSVWAISNEQYYFILHRLAADSVMNAPLIDITWKNNQANLAVKSGSANSNFPELYNLNQICTAIKEAGTDPRTRQRPYNYFNDYYKGKQYFRTVANETSYPSGHGYFAGLFVRCMLYIDTDPNHEEPIRNMVEEWLHCRLQLGAHWNTDLIAGKELGDKAFDVAMNFDQFRDALLAARKELQTYRHEQQGAPEPQPETSDIEPDIETYLADRLNNTTDLTINRIFYKDGFFNTLCLPFSLTAEDIVQSPLAGCEVFEFESAAKNGEQLDLVVRPVNEIVAGYPYLIRWASGENIYTMTFHDVTITAASGQTIGEDIQFVGAIGQSAMLNGNQNQLFLGENNTLYWPDTDASLKGFRAYFQVTNGSVPSMSPARLVIRPNTPTSTGQIRTNEPDGKRLINGQFVIFRNGVMYSADGQMIR